MDVAAQRPPKGGGAARAAATYVGKVPMRYVAPDKAKALGLPTSAEMAERVRPRRQDLRPRAAPTPTPTTLPTRPAANTITAPPVRMRLRDVRGLSVDDRDRQTA